MTLSWWRLEMPALPELEESLIWKLNALGIPRVAVRHRPEAPEQRQLVAWLPEADWPEPERRQLEQALAPLAETFGLTLPPISWEQQDDEDWSLSWKQHWEPDPVGRRLLILPAWLELPAEHADVGRFVAKKGPLITLEAFAEAASTRPDLHLVMVGEGPLLQAARVRANELGVAGRVRFKRVCSPEQIADLMRQSRAFVQHSIKGPDGDQEGSPVAVIEAQMIGLPVVATHHGGIPEVVIDGETGLLVEEGDQHGMARAIGRLADHPGLAATLGRAGRERCLDRFTVTHHIEALTELISSLARSDRD